VDQTRRKPKGITRGHPNNDPIIELAAKLNALVYIHAWMIVGGNPRRPGGGNFGGDSAPIDVANLAERFPNFALIRGRSGGDWELGVRAVRARPNVYVEFSGSGPHSGQVDSAAAQIGADRLIWGGRGPSRSYPTESQFATITLQCSRHFSFS
jgi:predicted TIM-barrel fold metal-dependent hydrolase